MKNLQYITNKLKQMGLVIFIRKQQLKNYFRELLIGSINTGLGNEVLLCSGFFQELFKNNTYRVSEDGGFSDVLLIHNIELTTVGIHNSAWLQPYKNFRDNLQTRGVTITAMLAKRYHWHAKIYVLKSNGRPIFGIIGSSNMTRNAFGLQTSFNIEADVVLWIDEYPELNNLINEVIPELGNYSSEVIVADYNQERNFGLSIENRLQQLVDEVEKSSMKELPL